MILVDTSVWIDHLHHASPELIDALERAIVAQHPMVIGELSLGSIRDRRSILGLLSNLPSTSVATHTEVRHFVEVKALYGKGLSLVDVHLLASTVLTPGATLWTRDKRLAAAARELRIAHT